MGVVRPRPSRLRGVALAIVGRPPRREAPHGGAEADADSPMEGSAGHTSPCARRANVALRDTPPPSDPPPAVSLLILTPQRLLVPEGSVAHVRALAVHTPARDSQPPRDARPTVRGRPGDVSPAERAGALAETA